MSGRVVVTLSSERPYYGYNQPTPHPRAHRPLTMRELDRMIARGERRRRERRAAVRRGVSTPRGGRPGWAYFDANGRPLAGPCAVLACTYMSKPGGEPHAGPHSTDTA